MIGPFVLQSITKFIPYTNSLYFISYNIVCLFVCLYTCTFVSDSDYFLSGFAVLHVMVMGLWPFSLKCFRQNSKATRIKKKKKQPVWYWSVQTQKLKYQAHLFN